MRTAHLGDDNPRCGLLTSAGMTHTHRFRSLAIAACLVLGPLAILVEHLLLDPLSADENAAQLALVAAHQPQYVAGNLAGLVGAVLLVPAVLGVVALVRGKGAGLANSAGALLVIACVATGGVMTAGLLMARMADPGADRAQMAALLDRFTASAPGIVVVAAFVGGIAFGLWLLAAALWRSRLVPAWVPIVLALVPLLDLVLSGEVVGAVAWIALLVAFGSIALTLVRHPQAWSVELPQVRRLRSTPQTPTTRATADA